MKKGVIAGFISVMITLLSATFVSLSTIGEFMPYKLVEGANLFILKNYSDTIAFLIMSSIIFIIVTVFNMNKAPVI